MNIIRKQLQLLPKVTQKKKINAAALFMKDFYQNSEGIGKEKFRNAMKEFKNHKQEYIEKASEFNANNPPNQLSLFDQLILSHRNTLKHRLKGKHSNVKIPVRRCLSSYNIYLQQMVRLDDSQFQNRFGQVPGAIKDKFRLIGNSWQKLSESEKLEFKESANLDKGRFEKEAKEFEDTYEVQRARKVIADAFKEAKNAFRPKPKKKKIIKVKKVKKAKKPNAKKKAVEDKSS